MYAKRERRKKQRQRESEREGVCENIFIKIWFRIYSHDDSTKLGLEISCSNLTKFVSVVEMGVGVKAVAEVGS
jgi:hypothetical protein